ncbi:dj-1 family protein [Colletotrichum truncatum]|uniref:Dj-1 family protein n=1 Tax=Colletotrichum truncatum TaxID=5467 RepID=A0ACC3ZA72_COLTU|nr:dj-1 family protein [Colletotrichum truncatum]KAF6796119.1 dj-1 family protein [Colletotrichum truncatum]
MKFTILTVVTTAATFVAGNPLTHRSCTGTPVNYGAIIFPGMDMIDIWGPLDILQLTALSNKLNLHLIAADKNPIVTGIIDPSDPTRNKFGSSFWPTIVPTATFDDDLDLDVLLVPGGPGVRAPGLEPIVEYVKRTYPKVKYLITVCTGASFAARAGILDGRRATTNKRAWQTITAFGPKVKWVSPARYVVDGNIWSSSGITSSLDLTYAFVEAVYGKNQSTIIANTMEHTPLAADNDVFADIWGVAPTGN